MYSMVPNEKKRRDNQWHSKESVSMEIPLNATLTAIYYQNRNEQHKTLLSIQYAMGGVHCWCFYPRGILQNVQFMKSSFQVFNSMETPLIQWKALKLHQIKKQEQYFNKSHAFVLLLYFFFALPLKFIENGRLSSINSCSYLIRLKLYRNTHHSKLVKW